jgi:cytochrome c553
MANRALKILGIILGSIVGLIVIVIGGIYFLSGNHLKRKYSVNLPALTIGNDSATVERGRHLVTGRLGCTGCHGEDLAGTVVVDAQPFGRFVASNLTTGNGGVGKSYGEMDYVRAIRDGIRPDGTPLVFMPSEAYAALSGEDLADAVAYIRSMPPVDKVLPKSVAGPIGRMLIVSGKGALVSAEVIDHTDTYVTMPPPGPTVEYGHYLVSSGGCPVCHGPDLAGGKYAGPPEAPPARNITPAGIGEWSEADFLRVFREGKRPNGTPIQFMPWQSMGRMTDDELRAIYLYLKTVPSKPYPG